MATPSINGSSVERTRYKTIAVNGLLTGITSENLDHRGSESRSIKHHSAQNRPTKYGTVIT